MLSDSDDEWEGVYGNALASVQSPHTPPPLQVEPAEASSLQPGGRGRPRGTYGSSAFRQEMQDHLDQQVALKPSIEKAQEARRRNAAARRQAKAESLLAASATDNLFAEAQSMASYTEALSVGTPAQQGVFQAMLKQRTSFASELDADKVLDLQLEGKAFAMTFKTLSVESKTSNPQRRVLSIASATLEAITYLWGLINALPSSVNVQDREECVRSSRARLSSDHVFPQASL